MPIRTGLADQTLPSGVVTRAASAGEEYYAPTRGSTQQYTPKPSGVVTRAASAVAADHATPPPNFADFVAQHSIQMSRSSVRSVLFEPGHLVFVVDAEGKEIGKGKVFHVKGRWHGRSLEDTEATCVVDIMELKIEKWKRVQHSSEATGTTFEEAAARNGVAL